ncbi:sugar phosphate isomerase/epimerase family protein [Paenibacillus donghaensis]|uniref:Xylose isomerase-like TIM barrel domain-containing protein n=1 Tax=Paenibacillus donghaensis TaxID=414771 RepID=A0A2Z2KAS5_9BACL|nr:TIM barrel protein [Paenibacillus donghaensis]ASA20020.1 hypothetical protein B9T62_03930 [Paenibacillus donghaensis]
MTSLQSCAVSTYVYINRPLVEAIELLAAAGWKHIEIMCEGRHGELLDWTEVQLASLARMGQAQGIRWSIHSPITGCNPATADEQQRAAAEALLLDTLCVAEALGCSYVVLHAGELDTEGEATAGLREAAQARVVLFLQRILAETAGSETVIALENVPPYPGLLGTEVTELLELAYAGGFRPRRPGVRQRPCSDGRQGPLPAYDAAGHVPPGRAASQRQCRRTG